MRSSIKTHLIKNKLYQHQHVGTTGFTMFHILASSFMSVLLLEKCNKNHQKTTTRFEQKSKTGWDAVLGGFVLVILSPFSAPTSQGPRITNTGLPIQANALAPRASKSPTIFTAKTPLKHAKTSQPCRTPNPHLVSRDGPCCRPDLRTRTASGCWRNTALQTCRRWTWCASLIGASVSPRWCHSWLDSN